MSMIEDKVGVVIAKLGIPGMKTLRHVEQAWSHFASGGWICSLGWLVGSHVGFGLAFAGWATWSWMGEVVGDGHLKRAVQGRETLEQFIDFLWDITTRLAGPIIVLLIVR